MWLSFPYVIPLSQLTQALNRNESNHFVLQRNSVNNKNVGFRFRQILKLHLIYFQSLHQHINTKQTRIANGTEKNYLVM